jgi:isoleucyl-tRNA synthetase
MDVWFDSGSSHAAVLEERDELAYPADLYLEGNDQYRGWFQSSMLTSIATKGVSPYKTVITHGMIVDEERQKMSKSKGNGMSPQEITQQYGADILRLWVSSSDYRADMKISKKMFKQLSQNYLKIRNTARYIMGNLNGFTLDQMVPYDQMLELDKWALMKCNELVGRVRAAYDSYEFHGVIHAIHNFCVVDMSNFYLDVIKDRLYCDDGLSRLSAQTAIYRILDSLVRMLAPVLCFTADEIWHAMPHAAGDDERNVVLNDMPEYDSALTFTDAEAIKWEKIIAVRDDVNKALEQARGSKLIGKPLEAKVTITASENAKEFLDGCGQDLAKLFIVSAVDVQTGEGEGDSYEALGGVKIAVSHMEGEKCERCWIYDPTVGSNAEHPTLCARCASVLGNK